MNKFQIYKFVKTKTIISNLWCYYKTLICVKIIKYNAQFT